MVNNCDDINVDAMTKEELSNTIAKYRREGLRLESIFAQELKKSGGLYNDKMKKIGKKLGVAWGKHSMLINEQLRRAPKSIIKQREQTTEEIAFAHIESIIKSILKKGNLELLKKEDFCFVYYVGHKWVAFYPSLENLLKAHSSDEQHSCEYCDFLKSDECKDMRELWADEKV